MLAGLVGRQAAIKLKVEDALLQALLLHGTAGCRHAASQCLSMQRLPVAIPPASLHDMQDILRPVAHIVPSKTAVCVSHLLTFSGSPCSSRSSAWASLSRTHALPYSDLTYMESGNDESYA